MKETVVMLLFAGCSTQTSVGNTGPAPDGRVQVALLPQTTEQNLDILFVIDDSPSMLVKQYALVRGAPAFVQALGALPTGLPDLHIGVVGTDLGTKGVFDPEPGPGIGSGPGSCFGLGKDGIMASSEVTQGVVSGNFIADIGDGSGVRLTNYTGSLAEAIASSASLGASGCGFEQPLQAAQRALTQSANAGFLRDTARLAVIVLTDEDDCSLARSSLIAAGTETLGPLQSFRCTRFGVTCEQGGKTTDDMTLVGPKGGCEPNESLAYLTSVADTAAAIQSFKPDPRDILFAAIVGDSSALEVEMRVPPGGGVGIPALKHSCSWTDIGTDTAEIADPAIRINAHAKAYPRSRVETMCNGDVGGALVEIARDVRGLVGDACLTRDIALPDDCEAFDMYADGSLQPLPECGASRTGDCYHLVADPGCLGQGQRLHVTRVSPPSPDTMVSLRCKL